VRPFVGGVNIPPCRLHCRSRRRGECGGCCGGDHARASQAHRRRPPVRGCYSRVLVRRGCLARGCLSNAVQVSKVIGLTRIVSRSKLNSSHQNRVPFGERAERRGKYLASLAQGASNLSETAWEMRKGEVEVNLKEILTVLVEDNDRADAGIHKVDDLHADHRSFGHRSLATTRA
jgi:hypothetical protein